MDYFDKYACEELKEAEKVIGSVLRDEYNKAARALAWFKAEAWRLLFRQS